jgi:hypothetical protein
MIEALSEDPMVNETPPIQLRTSTAGLMIEANEEAWSQVRIIEAGKSRLLGAETLKYITTHFLDFFSDRTPGLRWVLSLSEVHIAVYGEHFRESTVLHLQDKDANMFARLVISDDERKKWIQELTRWKPA